MRASPFLGFLLGVWLTACTDRQHRNPLDPQSRGELDDFLQPLQALAGDRVVVLRWDYTYFDDVSGYRLYRREEGREFAPWPLAAMPAERCEFVDREVENGKTYEYFLTLLVDGEGERRLEQVVRATPGPEVCWVADASSGLVWKIAADGRNAWFGQGRFPNLTGMEVDRRDGSCWVSDGFFPGLYRISPEGEVERHPADVERAGMLALDPVGDRGWLVDPSRREVYWFSLAGIGDTLALRLVDAHFAEVLALAPWAGGCWIADREEGRVLFYDPEEARREFSGLARLVDIAAVDREQAWALIEGGAGLCRLDSRGEIAKVSLPFSRGISLEVEPQSGRLWVLGEEEVASLSPQGDLLAHWSGLSEARSLAVDEVHGVLWIATREWLLKFAAEGEGLARLGGFSGLLRVAIGR